MKALIINADDFGLTESCTDAIIRAYHEGKISSTTICANGGYFEKAVNLAFKNRIENRVGVHLNITEGYPLTDKIRKDRFFCNADGAYNGCINRTKLLTHSQKVAVYNEFIMQIQKVRSTGINITHSDSHHHIHTAYNITPIAMSALKASSIQKIRICRNIGEIQFAKKLLKVIYNKYLLSKNFSSTDLFGSIKDFENEDLSKDEKSLEIMVHPDFDKCGRLVDRVGLNENNTPVGKELILCTEFLCNYTLCSYYDLTREYMI